MILLGISWGITSTAAIMVDGKIVACASEERYNKIKNYDTYPKQAINACIKIAGIKAKDIDKVVWGSEGGLNPNEFFTHRYCNFSVSDMIKEEEEYWYPKLYKNKYPAYLKIFSDKIDLKQFPGKKYLKPILKNANTHKGYKMLADLRSKMIQIHLGISENKNVFVDHHKCHAAYAIYAMPNDSELLVFTLDGSGDLKSATVSVYKHGVIKKLYGSMNFISGRLYRHCTLILGMKMFEHEYKVMGLAPYSKPYHSDEAYKIYSETMYVDGLEFKRKNKLKDAYFYFKEKLKACRFDGIAGGIQRYIEDIICQWISNWMEHTGIRNVCFSGGVSMNIKANMEILERCKPDKLIVPGSGSDESLAIGACYLYAQEQGEKVFPLDNMYLGDNVDKIDGIGIASAMMHIYKVTHLATNKQIAKLLFKDKIIGICRGRMEFGARALGNRSILANPRNRDNVEKLNDKIKSRDFWMPFAPSIISERAKDYLELHKGADYSNMTIGARTTDLGKKDLIAALHPADKTARPHIVEKQHNPEYYDLIKEFEKLSGVGAVLNTSFNIHGLPIVRTAKDALEVFEKTDIDGVLIGETLILKK